MATANRAEWPEWAQQHYPSTPDECQGWEALEWHYPLHMNVLVVAHTRIEGTWKAYCHPVPGFRHSQEHQVVLDHGDELSEELARVMFSHLDEIPYAR